MFENSNRNNKVILIILAALLCVSVTVNIVQYCFATADSRENIVGTYLTGTENEFPSEDDEYILFYSDGKYMRYRQFQIFDEGTYTVGDDNIVELVSRDDAAKTYALWQGKQLFYTGSNNGSFLFKKVDDIPSEINVNEARGGEAKS
jgi:hypothetical protein